ncbi:DUF5339 domain-containing protein [Gilliamella sp. wkB112]|uniref:DUF5339 domain-containing protein n=1 Tax=Gilliamella sp. wkB112 TaxID=3120257 RepID=UPI00080DE645|nr:DUF5339 domain-containing protein [Gilliamella apicola]OCG01068.1 hypothetical protein A9G12_00455 [Gilliamella apicola]
MKKLVFIVALMGMSSIAMADLSATCKAYFEKVDKLVKSLPDDAETKEQTELFKQTLESGKKQVADLPEDQQDNACKQGEEALNRLEAALLSNAKK